MNFDYSPKVQELRQRLMAFMAEHIYPNEHQWHEHTRSDKRWQPVPIIEELKPKARAAGLWNLWRPKSHGGTLTNLEYAPLCEIMGRVEWAPEVFNCSAPDTGNMETLLKYGTPEQVKQWCEPLLEGKIRSAFLMTEPDVASSDATNIQLRMKREGNDYVINGRKWWSSGAGDPRCEIYIVMGKTDPDNPSRHSQQSMVLVPAGTPGIKILRHLPVFGYDDAPHGHMDVELRMCACRRPTCSSARDAASRSRKAASGRGASTTACASSARRSARSRRCAGGQQNASPSSGRLPTRASRVSASPRRAS